MTAEAPKIKFSRFLNSQTDLLSSMPKKTIKLVRHKDRREEYRELLKHRNGLLEYQRVQKKPVFNGCKYIISFVGGERRRSLLFGIFKVEGVKQGDKGLYYYDLKEVDELSYLNNRVVVDWGPNAISWHQWFDSQEKEMIELLPAGYLGTFPGLLNFTLDFEELQRLFMHPESNTDWRSHLSAVNGIYMILDDSTGQQYVGAAYGQAGIWQRWRDYASRNHGGSKELTSLLESDPNRRHHFRFSVLQPLPSNITQKEIVEIESRYKEKLGSRVHGLNSN